MQSGHAVGLRRKLTTAVQCSIPVGHFAKLHFLKSNGIILWTQIFR